MRVKKKGRLLGCFMGAMLALTALLPANAAAKGTEEKYVMTKYTWCDADGTVNWWSSYEYDGNGRMTKAVQYNADSDVNGWTSYEYDRNGNTMKLTDYDGGGTVKGWTSYEYDGDGNLEKQTGYNGDGIVERWQLREYDENGIETKYMAYNADGTLDYWISYEYDENGNVTVQTCYDGDDTVRYRYVYEYDGNGKRTKWMHYGSSGALAWVYLFKYDENGNLAKRMTYDKDGVLFHYAIYEYSLIKIDTPDGDMFAACDGFSFYKNEDGDITCYDSNGEAVINEFKCDGTYTYFFQADGTAMKDRLSYHPDGKHVIYFDKDGHEVFSDFANVKRSIADDPVDDFCFFDIYGYLYVDVVTYDKTGTVLYYANPYGVMERGKWFRFSDTVMYPGQNGLQPWEGAAGGYGYANGDGTLMTNQWTYDWEGRRCYMQGNGVALYE